MQLMLTVVIRGLKVPGVPSGVVLEPLVPTVLRRPEPGRGGDCSRPQRRGPLETSTRWPCPLPPVLLRQEQLLQRRHWNREHNRRDTVTETRSESTTAGTEGRWGYRDAVREHNRRDRRTVRETVRDTVRDGVTETRSDIGLQTRSETRLPRHGQRYEVR